LKETKSSLQDGEIVVLGDFTENYSFIIQDAAQAFHWNNQEAAIHPFVSYVKNSKNELENLCFAIISECFYHNTVIVYTLRKHLIAFLKEKVPNISEICYFSDGASAQYKNKDNFINLCQHNTDFGINAKWHFFATSHDKGPCDGVGVTIKHLAAHSSLQLYQMSTPAQLYSWAKEHLPSIHVQYVCNNEVEQTRHHLKFRFDNTRTVVGTCKYHAFLPISNTALIAKKYSKAQGGSVVAVAESKSQRQTTPFVTAGGYIAIVYEDHWWLGYVIEKYEEKKYIKSDSFIHMDHQPLLCFLSAR
jgi:hypothetical protein